MCCYEGEMSCFNGIWRAHGQQGTLTCYTEDGGPENVLSWRYEGSFDKGHATGQGTTTYGEQYPDNLELAGYIYKGDHDKGKADGRGTWYRPDGTKEYVGDLQADKYHGQGTWYRPDGTKEYVGDFQANEYHGQGTSYRHDGNIREDGAREDGTREYEGEWRASYWQGRGTLFRLDGITPAREGDCDWRNGSSHSYEDGSRYEGEWHDDGEQRHGWGILYDPNLNIVRKGWWQNDKPSAPPDRPDAP